MATVRRDGGALGGYMMDLKRFRPLTREQEQVATPAELVQANLRLVISIAKRYQGVGMDLPDLVGEGNIGLIRAAELFDVRFGTRFSTYATWWIKQALTRAITNQNSTVRLPQSFYVKLGRYRRFRDTFRNKHGRDPEIWRIRKHMNCTTGMLNELIRADKRITLGFPVASNNSDCRYDLEDQDYDPPDTLGREPIDILVQHEEEDYLSLLLRYLTPKQREVIRRRYGICRDRSERLHEIGEDLGVSKERIRQIEGKALAKLKVIAQRLYPHLFREDD